jgi:hypothetical protein
MPSIAAAAPQQFGRARPRSWGLSIGRHGSGSGACRAQPSPRMACPSGCGHRTAAAPFAAAAFGCLSGRAHAAYGRPSPCCTVDRCSADAASKQDRGSAARSSRSSVVRPHDACARVLVQKLLRSSIWTAGLPPWAAPARSWRLTRPLLARPVNGPLAQRYCFGCRHDRLA